MRPTNCPSYCARRRAASSSRRCSRCFLTAAGKSSILAAAVPVRRLYEKAWMPAKAARSASAQVAAKSSSVSPGKPAMMSVVMAALGKYARARATRERNCSPV